MNKFKNMLQEFQNYWNLKKSSESTNLGDVMGDVRNNVNRCYTGWLMVMGVKTTYTGLEEQETLIDVEQYFL